MGAEALVPVAGLMTGVLIVGFVQAGRTIRYYLDWRMRLVERQLGGKDPSLVKAIQDLQAEIAALRQREADAVLTFDSTLHALEARMKHLELRTLGDGDAELAPVGAGNSRAVEPARAAIPGR